MKRLFQLILACATFSRGYPLNCYQCIRPSPNGQCTQTLTCPVTNSFCQSTTVTSFAGNSSQSAISVQSCGTPETCVSGSINLGTIRTTLNSVCCNTNLCNSQSPAEWIQDFPNGKQCFTCDLNDCTSVLNCMGNENRCFDTTVTIQGVQQPFKGCASTDICGDAAAAATAAASISAQLGLNFSVNIACCDGNLCNSAQHVMESILLLLVPLTSAVLIY